MLYIDEPKWSARELWEDGWIKIGSLQKRVGCYIQDYSRMGLPNSCRQVEFSSPEKYREWSETGR
jgi:hypothetical protein